MKRGSTLFLRLVLFILGAAVLALCAFGLPSVWSGGSEEYPLASRALLMIIIGLEVSAVPFFIALWQAVKLLGYIDENTAFSEGSVKALKTIKFCGIAIAAMYVAGVPLLFPIAQADDAPGLVVMGMAVAGAPVVVAVFAAVLERLLRNAIDLKSENDLTV